MIQKIAYDPDARTAYYTEDNYAFRDVLAINVDTGEPGPSHGGGSNDSCSICELCSHLPGGQTLGGCLGETPGGGGFGKA